MRERQCLRHIIFPHPYFSNAARMLRQAHTSPADTLQRTHPPGARYSASQPSSVRTASSRIASGSVAIRVRWLPPGWMKAFMLRLSGVTSHAAPGAVHGSSPP